MRRRTLKIGTPFQADTLMEDLSNRGTENQVRKRTRDILEACAPGGGFCMGSGNSVTNLCKIGNYPAMVDETKKWNEGR